MRDAEHGKMSPETSKLVISPLSCSLIGETQIVCISPDTLAYKIYGNEKAKEKFNCNYGLNETYHKELNDQDLKIVGIDNNGDARIVELSDHRFFMATLFIPQFSSSAEKPHPLIVEYLNAAKAFQGKKPEVEIKI
jgi:CTP synthase (UTP-ammonia lyase)